MLLQLSERHILATAYQGIFFGKRLELFAQSESLRDRVDVPLRSGARRCKIASPVKLA